MMPRNFAILQAVRPRLNPYLVATMGLWGFNFVALKLLYREMTPPTVGVVRFVIMWAALALLCRALGIKSSFTWPERMRAWVMGFLAMGLYMVLFLQGMLESSAAEGAIILGASPVLTLLFAILVRQEKFRTRGFLGALVAISGVALVVIGGGAVLGGRLAGNLMILGSAVVWAASAVVSRPLMVRSAPLAVLTASMPGAILPLLLYGGPTLLQWNWREMSVMGWAMLLYVAIGAGAFGFYWFYIGIRQVGASRAMLHQYLVPCIATLAAWLTLGTSLAWTQAIGFAVILGGVSLAVQPQPQTPHDVPVAPEAA